MDVLEAAQDLVDQELHVIIAQLLRPDDVVQVSAHQMCRHVDLAERLQTLVRMEDVQKANHVLMVHVLEGEDDEQLIGGYDVISRRCLDKIAIWYSIATIDGE